MAKLKRSYSNRAMQALKVFALQIQVARKQRGWSEAELAERVGLLVTGNNHFSAE
ncbi:hypothetical protein [Zhongshania aquimaris]|uniref:Helix-turn-helix domain-containing protein n=1 Tax=Zhongshania aquimaris TaxID=2857107 RepID=A0ABS6VPW9_9GAMM|nr:hypothetical protein [Zhongshania aquimaris]MBW2940368.1 hypothetical protein [Zhongshania aquimaris]